MEAVLVISADSTSLRFAAYDGTSPGELSLIGKGHVALSGADVEFFVRNATSSHPEIMRSKPADGAFDHDHAIGKMHRWVDRHCGLKLIAIAHAATHRAERYPASALVTAEVLSDLEASTPRHEAHYLKAMRVLLERLPTVPHVACFDSATRGASLHVVHADEPAPEAPVAAKSADREKSIAADALRCIERTPTNATIHAFPAPAPEPRRESYPAVSLALTG